MDLEWGDDEINTDVIENDEVVSERGDEDEEAGNDEIGSRKCFS